MSYEYFLEIYWPSVDASGWPSVRFSTIISNDDNSYYYTPCIYNGIYNLQMLDANENMSKNDNDLVEWVSKEIKSKDKKQFLDNHLIPDVDLSFNNFTNFIDERESILIAKLKLILK